AREALLFEDPEGQRLALVHDDGARFEGESWTEASIPAEYALRGFYAVPLSTPRLSMNEPNLTRVLNVTRTAEHANPENAGETVVVYSMDGGCPGKEVHVIEQPRLPAAWLGAGGVHHVAFRLRDDEEQRGWEERLARIGLPTSGIIDRYYFKS